MNQEQFTLIYLKQGEYFISNGKPVEISTVLGSCISVTFYSPSKRIGAITHAILPSQNILYRHNEKHIEGRFVDSSIEFIVQRLSKLDIDVRELEIKLFGGSQMYGYSNKNEKKSLNIGQKNVESALMTLEKLGLRVRVSEVGGNRGRKVLFYPHKGEVWIKRIARSLHQSEVRNG